ncbi:MAG: Stp1/IreP family PP2C-type Ser/Thr phosphatase [Polyangiales bacterium]
MSATPTEPEAPEAEPAPARSDAPETTSEPELRPEATAEPAADPAAEPASEGEPAQPAAEPSAGEAEAEKPEEKLEERSEEKPEEKPGDSQRPVALPKEPAAEPLPKVVVRVAGTTDVGRIRDHNEDNFIIADLSAREKDLASGSFDVGERGFLFAVCDGMGGALAGEVASQMAVDVIHGIVQDSNAPKDRDDFAQVLVAAVQEAGARIFLAAKTNRNQHGMGTTATVAGVYGSTLFVGQVGDSRAYLMREGRLRQITKDQSLVSKLIEAGRLTEEQAETYEHAHIILQALGTADTVSVDLSFVDLRQGDALMLCSDGLSGLATNAQIHEALSTVETPADCCQRLVDDANDAGGHDNITVVVVRFEGELDEPGADDEPIGYQPFVLREPVEALVIGSAGATLKIPDLPPPGADVKKATSMPPGEFSSAVTAGRPAVRPMGEDDDAPPPPEGRSFLGWVALVIGLLAIGAVVWALSRGSNPATPAPPSSTPGRDARGGRRRGRGAVPRVGRRRGGRERGRRRERDGRRGRRERGGRAAVEGADAGDAAVSADASEGRVTPELR